MCGYAHTSRASFHFQQVHHLHCIRWWSRWAHESFDILSIIVAVVFVVLAVVVVFVVNSIIVGAGAGYAWILQKSFSHIHAIFFFSGQLFPLFSSTFVNILLYWILSKCRLPCCWIGYICKSIKFMFSTGHTWDCCCTSSISDHLALYIFLNHSLVRPRRAV